MIALNHDWRVTDSSYDPWGNCTSISLACVTSARPKSAAEEFAALVKKNDIYYEAIRQSRDLSVGPMPEPVVRRLDLATSDPLRVHRLRCVSRRPRLSLLERVRRV